MRLANILLLLTGASVPALAPAQGKPSPPAITAAEIDGHLRFLSSDLLEAPDL